MVRTKPKVDAIKELKTRRINERVGIGKILRAEEDGRCEDSPETLNHSLKMATVGREANEIEHLKGSFKVDDPAFLLDGEGGYVANRQRWALATAGGGAVTRVHSASKVDQRSHPQPVCPVLAAHGRTPNFRSEQGRRERSSTRSGSVLSCWSYVLPPELSPPVRYPFDRETRRARLSRSGKPEAGMGRPRGRRSSHGSPSPAQLYGCFR